MTAPMHGCDDPNCTLEQAETEGCLMLLNPAPFTEHREGAPLGTIYYYDDRD